MGLEHPAQSSTWKRPLNSTSFFPVTMVSPAGKAPTASLLPATPPALPAHVCPVFEVKSPGRRNQCILSRGLRRKGNRYTEQALLLLDLQQVGSGSVRVTLCPGSWSSSSSVTQDQQVTERVLWDMCVVQSGVPLWHSATHRVSRARKDGEGKERKSFSLSLGLRISFLFCAARPFCHIQSQPLCQKGKQRGCPYFLTASAGSLPPPSYTDL